nr:EndoU domain-containing protein [Kitasatospora sp. SID7827]
MGTWYRDGRDRPLLDLDRTGTTPGTDAPRGVLRARNLRQLGATVDAAFGPAPSPHPDLPARARFGEDTRRTALYGGPNGGGHLYAPAGSGRERPAPVPGGGHRNGTFRVVGGPAEHLRPRPNDPAGDLAGARHRTVFPEHWTADDAVYAAEQAYQHALRTGNTTRTGPYAYHWEGEYAGVRIEGEVKAGEFTSFRPADRQSDLDTPAYAPWHSTRQPFDLRGDDLLQYGDRHTMTGAHHAPTPAAAAAHGIRIERLPEPARPNGTYRATVHYLDPTIAPGAPLARQDTHWHTPAGAPPHTMYPEHWTLADVHAAVEEAYRNRRDPRPPGTGAEHWVGEARGVRIEGVTRDGRHLVHRPTDDQPGTPAPTHRSAPLREPATPGTGHRPPTATPAPLPAQPPHPDLRRAAPTPPQTPHAPHVPGNDLPEPGRRIDVPDDGLCLLHAVGVSAPELVAGHPLREKATARRLIDRIAAHFGSLDLAAVPPDIIRMVRARDLGQQQYYHREELRQLLTPGQRAAADGHSYQDLRLQALTGLFERSNPNWTQELSREALLAHLAPEDRAAAADLDHARLAELVREQTRRSDETMLPSERTGLLRAINAWAWNSDYGDSFPALVAHALNLRLRVIPVGPGADQLVGPENGRPLAIYRDGARVHYQASEPPPHPLLSALAAADPALVRKAARPHPATGPAPDPVRVLREAIADYLNTDNRRLPQDLLALVRPGGRHLAPEPTGNLSHHQALTELRRRFGDPDDPLSPTESDLLPSLLAHALDIRFRPTDESPDTVGPAHAPLVELGHPPKDRRAEEETAKAKAKAEAEEAARVLREREEKLAREREEAKAKAEEAARVLREREREEAEAKEREKKEQQGERQEDGEALRAKERAEQEQARLRRAKERAEQERARLRRVEEREEAARLQRVRREEDERARQQEAAEKLRAERAEQERARLEREKEREKARAEAQEKQRLAEEKRERLEREEAEDAARPPKTVIDGGDLVLALSANEVALRQKVIEVLVAKAKGDRDAVRAFAEAYFGPAVLRPILAAVSRGETWRAPFRGNGWSGEVVLRGKLARAERRKGRTKIEFENGADRSVAVGGRAEKQWQFAVGGQLRHTNDDIQLAELVGYFHDRGEGETHVEVSGVVARSKTSVDAVVYDSTMALELDFSGLRHHRAPVRPDAEAAVERVEVGLTVAAPRYQAPPKDVELVPPSRLARDGRIGGQEIVLELTPRARQSDAGQSDAVPKTPVELLLDAVWAEATAQVRENWPALRAKILAEVDFARLHHELKSATAGEPITVVLTDADGEPLARVDITAKVRDLRVVGVTDPTEFNIGTVVQQVSGSQRSRGHAGQFPLFPTTGPALGDGIVNGGANQRHAREGVVIEGSSLTSQLTSKAKVPGVLYEGTVEFTVSFNGKEGKPAGAADVRLLVDRRDTEERSLLPKPETVPATVPETGNVEAASTHRILGPADDVWANGLDDTVVVRDLEGTAALREALDAKGAERYGKDWPRIREEVLATVNLPRLAAHMTALSRGESVEVKLGGKDGIVVTFTAELDRLTHRRVDDEAELNPVSETNAFSEVRGLSSRTDTLHFQAGGKGKDSASGIGVEVTPVGSAQQRAREGWRDRSNERVVANGKYKLPQVLYGAELTVRVEVDVKGRKATAGEKVTVEIGLDKTSTVERELPKGQKDFERPKPKEPQSDANENANANENADGGKKPGEDEDKKPDDQPPVPVLPSRVKSRNELNASYVVHSLGSTADVRAKVKAIIGAKHTLTAEHASRIDRAFKHLVLKGQLSRLSRGAKLTETVGGRLWSAEIVLTAKVREPVAGGEGKAPVPPRPVKGYEFESGSRASRGQGYVQDRVLRGTGGVQAKVKALALEGAVGHVQRRDQTHGEAADVVGSVSNRGKHVEDAAVFDLDAVYDVEVRFTWMGREDGPPVTDSASVRARVAVPLRDAVADTVPKVRPEDTEAQAAAKRAAAAEAEARKLAESLERDRLDSSAIVTDVHSVTEPGEGPRRTLGESLVDQLEDGPRRWKDAAEQRRPGWTAEGWQRAKDAAAEVGRLAKGLFASRDWARMRAELEGELTPDRLQARLKGMLAGDRKPLRIGSVTVETGAVLVGRLEHLGAAGTTEFNAGTDVQHGFADSGSETHSGTGRGHSTNLGGAGTVPGTVPVTIGLAGNYGRGRDWIEAQAKSVASGSASKAKVPGSAYRGEAELQFTITWKPRFGRKVVLRTTARVGFETLIETAETGPVVKPAASGAKEGPALPYKPGPEQAVRVPPERVWKEGLGDTDVLRWLGDVGGLQDMVRELEVKHFGGSTDTARSVTSHSYLSALFSAATRGTDPVSAGQPGSWPLGGDKSLELGVKILELDYQGKDAKIELSPANGFTAGASGTALSSSSGGGQLRVGLKFADDFSHSPALLLGAQRTVREGGGQGGTGQTVSNGKYPTEMARYSGYARIEAVALQGGKELGRSSGVLPFTVDIPFADTSESKIPSDTFLAFSETVPEGDLRFNGDPRILEDAWELLYPRPNQEGAPRTPLDAETRGRLAGLVQLGRAAYGTDFTVHSEAGRHRIWTVHRLAEAAGGARDQLNGLIRELLPTKEPTEPTNADIRRLLEKVERWLSRRHGGQRLTPDELRAAARNDWRVEDDILGVLNPAGSGA